jgi:hypothetical protein
MQVAPMLSEGGEWNFNVKDSVALMGAQTIMSTQGCMKDGPKIDTTLALNDHKICTGRLKAFSLKNYYYKVLVSLTAESCVTACGQASTQLRAFVPASRTPTATNTIAAGFGINFFETSLQRYWMCSPQCCLMSMKVQERGLAQPQAKHRRCNHISTHQLSGRAGCALPASYSEPL